MYINTLTMLGRNALLPVIANVLKRQVHENAQLLERITEVVNRNPRNLERLRIARKPQGYHLDIQDHEYWHRLVIVEHARHISAEIHHFENGPVITAATNEQAIMQQLYRKMDRAAYFNLGRVLAQRCLESGISTVYCPKAYSQTQRSKSLIDAFEAGGVMLEEGDVYKNPVPSGWIWPEKTWNKFE